MVVNKVHVKHGQNKIETYWLDSALTFPAPNWGINKMNQLPKHFILKSAENQIQEMEIFIPNLINFDLQNFGKIKVQKID